MKQGTLDLETSNSPIETVIEGKLFRNFISTLIIVNAVILGILTYERVMPANIVSSLGWFDQAVTIVFCIEIGLKLIVYRLNFFKSGWNWFDFLVVGISLVPGVLGLDAAPIGHEIFEIALDDATIRVVPGERDYLKGYTLVHPAPEACLKRAAELGLSAKKSSFQFAGVEVSLVAD